MRDSVRIVTFRELPSGGDADCVLLMHHAFGSSWDPGAIGTPSFEAQYPRHADYVGVCALDRGRVVSAVLVHRFPVRTRRGSGTCSGLGAVATLPTHTRRGLARTLIEEVHRRERENGSPFVFLYTGRSIVAHRLYESLGYHDVYDFPKAVRWVPVARRGLPRGWRWRRATIDDRQSIVGLRAELGRARFGFTREGVDWWPGAGRWFAPERDSWFVLEQGRNVVAYAGLRAEGELRACNEAMARTLAARHYLLRSLESEAPRAWLLLGAPVLAELRGVSGLRAYRRAPSSYSVLMARSLDRPLRSHELIHELGTDRPGFLMGVADAF